MPEETLKDLIEAASLVTYKIAILVVGFLFAFLGYKLLIKGISGGFKLSAEYKGIKADLISASPGIFFILTGTIIISIGLYKGLTFEEERTIGPPPSSVSKESSRAKPPKIELPRTPPGGDPVTNNGG
jgi:hypothetical protein